MHKIGFIGGGKIAQAMAKGFIKAGMLIKSYENRYCTTLSLDCIYAFL